MKTPSFPSIALSWGLLVLWGLSQAAFAQGTSFTHQGRLSDNGVAAHGQYDLQFWLFDAATGGAQQDEALTLENVQVTNGVFSVQLDFGAAFDGGAARWLEIRVRPGVSTGLDPYTILTPRQRITPTSYAIRSRSAATADNAANAANATSLGGVAASSYLQTNGNGSGLTNLNAANITTGTLNSARLGIVPLANGGTGSATQNFVDLTTAQTIGGNKTFSATLTGNVVNAATQFNLSGNRVLVVHGPSNSNTFAGVGAGLNSQPDNGFNTFFGVNAGQGNVAGANITAIGALANVGADPLSNATALGFRAQVNCSNCLVLGGVTGVNNGASVNVGIGTANPVSRLHVRHDLPVSNQPWPGLQIESAGQTTFRGGLRMSGLGFLEATNDALNLSANYARLSNNGQWTAVSDARRKRDITSLSGLLAKALQLRPVSYYFHSDPLSPSAPKSIGFLAQEVEPLFPSLVADDGELKTLNYAGLSVVAIGALQEQQQQLRTQQAELQALNAANAVLAAQLKAVLARLAELEKTVAAQPAQR